MIHLGNRVSALVDGQLAPAEAERWWAHVHGCELCRRQVEREGWVKTRLAGLAMSGPPTAAPERLRGSLAAVTGWPDPVPDEPGRRRLAVATAIGAGSLGAALVGVLAVTVPANAPGVDRRLPVTSLTRPSEPAGTPDPGRPRERDSSSGASTTATPTATPAATSSRLQPGLARWVTIAP